MLSAQSYHFEQYSVGEGLPQSQVYALLQDSRGYLWLGTQGGGLARFDGENFTSLSKVDGMSGNYVQAIAEGENGDIWLGTNNGLNRFDGKKLSVFTNPDYPNLVIQDLAVGEGDTLWLATQQGVFGQSGGTIFSQKNKDGKNMGRMWSAFTDSQGNVWMGGGKGIFRKDKNRNDWHHAWRRKTEVLALAESADGRLVAGVFDLGLRIWDGKKWEKLTVEDGLPSNRIQAIWLAPDGRLWLGTQNAGAAILTLPDTIGNTPLDIVYLTEREGLCNKNIRSIKGDRWGNVWLGTSGGGVCRYGGEEFEHLTRDDGLKSNFIYSMAEDTSGGLWLSSGDKGFSFRMQDSLVHFGADNGFYDFKCRSMYRASDGRIWIGTEGAGIATLLETDTNGIPRFRLINRQKGLTGNWIRDIVEDDDGNLWVATTDGGVGRLTINDLRTGNYIFKNYGRKEGLPVKTINQLHFEKNKNGRLWMAAQRQGLFYLNYKSDEKINKVELPPMTIRSLAEDELGNLWLGTAGKGLGRINISGDTLEAVSFFDVSDGLASSNIYLLQFDPQNNLWVGSERGVDRISFDASGNPVDIKNFGLAEGFRGVEVCQNSSLLDSKGNLWFGTVNGLTSYRASEFDSAKLVQPKVHLCQVNLFYEPIEETEFHDYANPWGGLRDSAYFPYKVNDFGFEFFAPNFSNPDAVVYSWQLKNWEEKPTPWVKQNLANYANLPPGIYSFSVRAKNEDGIISEPVDVSFVIETPFWQTTWFKFSLGAFLIVLIGGILWSRFRRLRKKAEAEKEKLEMENHLLQLEQKARQLQMNPHFIFNALNSIQSLVVRKDSDGARHYILKFGKLMRGVLDNSRKELIPLEKEMDTLNKYLEMEQFCRDGNFNFKISTQNIESDDLEIPPMLVQPFVENAILHGVGPLKNKKGEIEILFSEKGQNTIVEIKDNGVGFDAENNSKENKSGRTSAGIEVTKERIKILGGKIKIDSAKGNGTLVRIELPK